MSTAIAFANKLARAAVTAALLATIFPTTSISAQAEARIRDLTTAEGAVPVRLMGYGLVVGLDGTGDRAIGGQTAGQTVQSVVNLLRRFDIEVPPAMLRMRNVAAVLVTAEMSPYLRAGGRFEIQVSSMGDARSLRGGVLYMTPLQAEPGGPALATAQGPLLVSEGGSATSRYAPTIETSARIPSGGILEADLPRPTLAQSSARLFLREPDLGTATRIVSAINSQIGDNSATIEDEGAIRLNLPAGEERAAALAKVLELAVRPDLKPRLVIDGKDGTVVVGGDITIGPATVSHGGVTLSITDSVENGDVSAPGSVRMIAGTPVQNVATALHAVQTPPQEIAAIFAALRDVGAISAEIIVR